MIPFIELFCKRAGPTAPQCFRVALSEEGRSKGRRFYEVKEAAAAVVVMIGSLCRLPAALRLAGRSRPSGYFMQQLSQGGPNANGEGSGSKEAVERLVRAHSVVVFIKGSPTQPQCGFSNAVVQILRLHGVNDYRAYDVLQDPDLRQGIKNYSNWPTIPQVYFNGEFVGGCDILLQMHQSGDLVEELKKLGIQSALLESKKDRGKE